MVSLTDIVVGACVVEVGVCGVVLPKAKVVTKSLTGAGGWVVEVISGEEVANAGWTGLDWNIDWTPWLGRNCCWNPWLGSD